MRSESINNEAENAPVHMQRLRQSLLKQGLATCDTQFIFDAFDANEELSVMTALSLMDLIEKPVQLKDKLYLQLLQEAVDLINQNIIKLRPLKDFLLNDAGVKSDDVLQVLDGILSYRHCDEGTLNYLLDYKDKLYGGDDEVVINMMLKSPWGCSLQRCFYNQLQVVQYEIAELRAQQGELKSDLIKSIELLLKPLKAIHDHFRLLVSRCSLVEICCDTVLTIAVNVLDNIQSNCDNGEEIVSAIDFESLSDIYSKKHRSDEISYMLCTYVVAKEYLSTQKDSLKRDSIAAFSYEKFSFGVFRSAPVAKLDDGVDSPTPVVA